LNTAITSDQKTNILQVRVTVAKGITASAHDAGLLLLMLLLIDFGSTFNAVHVPVCACRTACILTKGSSTGKVMSFAGINAVFF
jgi:hypothetical protein